MSFGVWFVLWQNQKPNAIMHLKSFDIMASRTQLDENF